MFGESEGISGYCDLYDGYLYVYVEYRKSGQKVYRCREDEKFESDPEDLDEYFPESYEGDSIYRTIDNITVKATYSERYGKYIIDDIRATDTWQPIALHDDNMVKIGDEIVIFESDKNNNDMRFGYKIGDGEYEPISCLLKSKYNNSELYQYLLTCDDGNTVIGLMNVSLNPNIGTDLMQSDVENDILFSLNTQTGESQIIYDTKDNRTRIIGYEDGTVYLFKDDYKVYSQPIEGGELTEIIEVPETQKAYFDWKGDYLVIGYIPIDSTSMSRYEIITAKVK